MDVNLKASQDAGASSYSSSARSGGFSVASTPQTPKPSAEVQTKTPSVTIVKSPDESKDSLTGLSSQVVLSEEELQTVTADLTKLMQSLNTDIQFSIHKTSGRMIVRVVDSLTKDILKEFPPEELLDTIGAIREYVGALLDKKV